MLSGARPGGRYRGEGRLESGRASMRRVLVLQHHGCETPGLIGDALARASIGTTPLLLGDAAAAIPEMRGFDGLLVLGGPFSVYHDERYPFLRAEMRLIEGALKLGKPVLGVCLGSQMLAQVLGGPVRPAAQPEIGWLSIRLEPAAREDRLFGDLPQEFVACVWHGDVFDLPAGAVSLARSELTECQAYRFGGNVYGLLFHLEMRADMVAACVGSFEPRLQAAGIAPADCIAEAAQHLSRLAPLAAQVFDRWASLVRAAP